MCTVTYIPQGKEGFILTSNRDEQAGRSPQNIAVTHQEGLQLAFPRDTGAGGSWIAVGSNNKMICLLNGAFVKHRHQPPYKRSRGLMALDFFNYADARQFFADYDFVGMEPFTTIIYDQDKLFEFRWDEKNTYVKLLDPGQNYLWASATLYPPPVQTKRQQWFAEWLENRTDYSQEAILDFHHRAGDGDPRNDVIMNRDGIVQTVSITSIRKTEGFFSMYYEDLLRERISHVKIELDGEVLDRS